MNVRTGDARPAPPRPAEKRAAPPRPAEIDKTQRRDGAKLTIDYTDFAPTFGLEVVK